MSEPSPIRKVFEGVATRQQMFALFDRHAARPRRDPCDDATLYAGEWFEISERDHDYMFEILPPLWIRGEMFSMREFMIGSVTSVFYTLRVAGRIRHFHGYCDLCQTRSPEAMRISILERESQPGRPMTRCERLEHIWSTTAEGYRGYAGAHWPASMQGQRTIFLWRPTDGGGHKLLDALTDDEIAAKLPVQLRRLAETVAA